MPVTPALFECGNKARWAGSARRGGGFLDGIGIYGTQGAGAVMKGFFKGCEGLWSAARIPGGACSKDLTLPRLGDEIPC